MYLEIKQRIVASFDELLRTGAKAPFKPPVHPDTARAAALHATHVDLGCESPAISS